MTNTAYERCEHAWDTHDDDPAYGEGCVRCGIPRAAYDKLSTLLAREERLKEEVRTAVVAERAANIEKLEGLFPLERDPILDAARGALERGILAIRLSPYARAALNGEPQ